MLWNNDKKERPISDYQRWAAWLWRCVPNKVVSRSDGRLNVILQESEREVAVTAE
jgi:hypothetical protein